MSAIIFSIRENNKSCNSSDGGGNSVGGGSSDVGGNIRLKNAWVRLNTNSKNFLKLNIQRKSLKNFQYGI